MKVFVLINKITKLPLFVSFDKDEVRRKRKILFNHPKYKVVSAKLILK